MRNRFNKTETFCILFGIEKSSLFLVIFHNNRLIILCKCY